MAIEIGPYFNEETAKIQEERLKELEGLSEPKETPAVPEPKEIKK